MWPTETIEFLEYLLLGDLASEYTEHNALLYGEGPAAIAKSAAHRVELERFVVLRRRVLLLGEPRGRTKVVIE